MQLLADALVALNEPDGYQEWIKTFSDDEIVGIVGHGDGCPLWHFLTTTVPFPDAQRDHFHIDAEWLFLFGDNSLIVEDQALTPHWAARYIRLLDNVDIALLDDGRYVPAALARRVLDVVLTNVSVA